MREWVPLPGSAKARLVEAALHGFEQHGFEACSVTELAAKAGVTTGSLYHHFGSKAGLYTVVRGDLEKRVIDRMEGAAAVVVPPRHPREALLVAFDAAVRFDACRLLGERPLEDAGADPIASTLSALLPPQQRDAAEVLVAAWRAALLLVAGGSPVARARAALVYASGG